MPPLPVISGDQAQLAFLRLGWRFARRKGSHVMLVQDGIPINLSIPLHQELDTGTLRSLIRKAGLSVPEFIEALEA